MSDNISDKSWATSGLDVGTAVSLASTGFATLLTQGIPSLITSQGPKPNALENSWLSHQNDPTVLAAQGLTGKQSALTSLLDVAGNIIVPTVDSLIEMGSGHQLSFDPATLAGRISPILNPNVNDVLDILYDAHMSFTGTDLRVMIEIPNIPTFDAKPRYAKQLFECTTLTISVHREQAPVPAAGYVNTKGFAHGRRTIAGTMILTQFTCDVLAQFLHSVLQTNADKSLHYLKVDQLPTFNMTLFFSNEFGYASYRRLLGVCFVTDGTVYSVQDMMSEQTISYMASDFTPLLPLSLSSLFWPLDLLDRATRPERSGSDLLARSSLRAIQGIL